jgi:hypothetical protein
MNFVPLEELDQEPAALTFVPLEAGAPAKPVAAAPTVAAKPTPVAAKPVVAKTEPNSDSQVTKGVKSGIIGLKSIWEGLSASKDVAQVANNLRMLDMYDKVDKGELNKIKVAPDDFLTRRALNRYLSDPKGRMDLRDRAVKEVQDRKEFVNATIKTLQQYQEENKKNKGRTEDVTEIAGLKDFGDWAAFNFGAGAVQLVPIIAAAVTTGGAGVFAVGTGMELGGGTNTRINYILEQTKGETDPQKRADAVTKYVQESGDVTLTTALLSGAVDRVLGPAAALIRRPLTAVVKEQARAAIAKEAVKKIAKQAGEEGLAEGIQEGTQVIAASRLILNEDTGDVLSTKNAKRIAQAASVGALVGGGVQAGTSAVQVAKGPEKTRAVPPAKVEPTLAPKPAAAAAPVTPAAAVTPTRVEPTFTFEPLAEAAPSERVEPTFTFEPLAEAPPEAIVPSGPLAAMEAARNVDLETTAPPAVPLSALEAARAPELEAEPPAPAEPLAAMIAARTPEIEVEPPVPEAVAPPPAVPEDVRFRQLADAFEAQGEMADDAEMLAAQTIADERRATMQQVAAADTTGAAERAQLQAEAPDVIPEPPSYVTEPIADQYGYEVPSGTEGAPGGVSSAIDRGLASAESLAGRFDVREEPKPAAITAVDQVAGQIQTALNRDPYADVGWAVGEQWMQNKLAEGLPPDEHTESVFERFNDLAERGHPFGAKPVQPRAAIPTEIPRVAEAPQAVEAKEERPEAPAAAPAVTTTPEINTAKDLLTAIDKGGVPLNPAKLNNVARDIGLDVSKSAKPEETIRRIRNAVERAEAPAVTEPAPLELEAARREELEVEPPAIAQVKASEAAMTKAGTARQRAPGAGRPKSEIAKTPEDRKAQTGAINKFNRDVTALVTAAKKYQQPTGQFPTEREYDYAEAARIQNLEKLRKELHKLSLVKSPQAGYITAKSYIRGLKPAEAARAKALHEGAELAKLPTKPPATLTPRQLERFRKGEAAPAKGRPKAGVAEKELPAGMYWAPAADLRAATSMTEAEYEEYLNPPVEKEIPSVTIRDTLKAEGLTDKQIDAAIKATEEPPAEESESRGTITRVADPAYDKFDNLQDALAHIIRTGNNVEQQLAAHLLDKSNIGGIKEVDFAVVQKQDRASQAKKALDKDARGLYMLHPDGSASVYVRGDSYGEGQRGNNAGTVLHEAFHAAGNQKINYALLAEKYGEKVDPSLADAVAQLNDLMGRAKEVYDAKEAAGELTPELKSLDFGSAFTNVKEFYAYGMTSPAMQSFLTNDVPGTNAKSSGFTLFVDIIMKLLRIDPSLRSGMKDLILISQDISVAPTPSSAAVAQMLIKENQSLVSAAKNQEKETYRALDKLAKTKTASETVEQLSSLTNVARDPKLWGDYLKLNYRNMATPAYKAYLANMPTEVLISTGTDMGIGGLKDVNAGVQKMAQFRTKKLNVVQETATPWIKLGAKESSKLADVMHMATDIQVDPATNKSNDKLNAMWKALTPEAKKVYTSVRDFYKNNYDLYRGLLNKRVEMSSAEGSVDDPTSDKGKLAAAVRATYEAGAKVSPYFPLMRYGDYYVSFGKGKNAEFQMFETAGLRDAYVEARVKELNASGDKRTFEQMITDMDADVGNSLDKLRDKAMASSPILKNLFSLVDSTTNLTDETRGDIKNEIFQLHLATLPEASFRKQFITRKGTAGFSGDALRNFINSGTRFANQLARIKYGPDIMNGIDAADESLKGNPDKAKLGMLVDEVRIRAKAEVSPDITDTFGDKFARFSNKFAFVWLLTSAKSAANQMFSLANFTAPTLAKYYGWGAVGAEMTRFMTAAHQQIGVTKVDRAGNTKLTLPSLAASAEVRNNPELRRAAQEMIDRGISTNTQTNDLFMRKGQPSADYNPYTANAVQAMGFLFHNAERLSKEVAFMTAFRLARKAGKSFDEAINSAVDITNESLFDYSTWNAPRTMRSAPARVVTQFLKFPLFATVYLVRNFAQMIKPMDGMTRRASARAFFGTLGITGLMAGVPGLPFYSVIMGVAQGIKNLMKDDDEEEVLEEMNVKKWFENIFLPDFFGGAKFAGMKLSEIAASGVLNAASGYDFATGISMDFWLKGGKESAGWKNAYQDFILSHLGPAVGAWSVAASGIDDLVKGDYKKGAEKLSPAFFRGAITASRYAEEGARTPSGDVVKEAGEFTEPQLMMQRLGFKTTGLAQEASDRFYINQQLTKIKDMRKNLINQLDHAAVYDNDEQYDKVRDKIDNFNDRFPHSESKITSEDIQRALEAREKRRRQSERGLYVERPYRDIEDVRERGLRLLEGEAAKPKSEPKSEPKMEFKPIDPAVDSPPPAKVSEFRLNNAIEEEGAAHLTPVITAIFNQESSGGKDTRTSVDDARGPMQIIPSTFKMYAKEGERINDPADNMRVGVRYIKDIASKYGDDPARIATAYFSGEGNVNKGKGNAWKQDYADGNGKRTSAYARDVVNRIEKMKEK